MKLLSQEYSSGGSQTLTVPEGSDIEKVLPKEDPYHFEDHEAVLKRHFAASKGSA
jgi:hypothetical protein